MSATIYYMREHYRAHSGAVALRAAPARPKLRSRSGVGFMIGVVIFVVALVMIGVWLTTGVASIGRANGECLTSARRVCGVFPSEHASTARLLP